MRKHKAIVGTIQAFCGLLLIMSKYLEPGVTQMAYCFMVFASPFLLLAFGEEAFSKENSDWSSAAVFIAEFLVSFIFVGAMITGMKTGTASLRGFGALLFVYCLAAVLSIAERVVTRAKI